MSSKTIRVGIIGCGDVAEKKSGPAFQKVPGSELAIVMRRDGEKARDYALRHGVPRHTADAGEILSDPGIDLIYVATPPHMHAHYGIQAALHGKAVYVEKPMGRTVAEARALQDACRQHGVPLFVAYYRRGQERFNYAKDMILRGELGEVRAFHYLYTNPTPSYPAHRAWLGDPALAGGGQLFDIGSHMMNALTFILGDPVQMDTMTADRSGLGAPDTHSAILTLKNGVQGTVQMCFSAAGRRDQFTVLGSTGSLSMSFMNYTDVVVTRGETTESLPFPMPEHVQLPLITRVINTLRGLDDLDTTARDAFLTQELLEAMHLGQPWRKQEGANT